jgi:hypothetical protein
MFDTAFELLLELIHITLEFVEEMLDMLIEHIFHTDLHDTQVIVFLFDVVYCRICTV